MIYLCRHAETEWSISGQHTGVTEISLTANGKKQAVIMGRRIRSVPFHKIICSPRKRALESCELAGFSRDRIIIDPDLTEWDYGEYEGQTSNQIKESNPGWDLFEDGAPGGETPEEVGARADKVLQKLHLESESAVAIFSHGHFSRVLGARWLGLPPRMGAHFFLSVASVSILGFEHNKHVIQLWNDTGKVNF